MCEEIEQTMLPLWLEHPNYSRQSMGWRMGPGEGYKYKWLEFWKGLTAEQKQEYKAKYPEPEAWEGYYSA